MHNSCRCALITMTGAIVLAAATIAVGFSANDAGDGGRNLKTIPAAPLGIEHEFGTPMPDSHLTNRS
jgi:hypothetical protein